MSKIHFGFEDVLPLEQTGSNNQHKSQNFSSQCTQKRDCGSQVDLATEIGLYDKSIRPWNLHQKINPLMGR